MNAREAKELAQLADAHARGEISEREARRLTRLLDGAMDAQDAYLDALDMHAMLYWEFRRDEAKQEPQRPAPSTPATRRVGLAGSVLFAGAVAATVMIAAWVGWLNSSKIAQVPATSPAQSTFARITGSAGDRWANAENWAGGEEQLALGVRVGPRRLRLESGIAQIQYDSGVVAILTGPADFELSGPQRAYLHAGRVVLRVPPSAIGYTVETAEANVVDLGTEFGVQSDRAVGTDIQVYEGEVVAESKRGAEGQALTHRLLGGQAMRLGNRPGDQPEELAFWPDRFVRYLPDPRDPEAPNDPGRRRTSPYNEARHEAIRILPASPAPEIDGSLDDWDLSASFSSRCEPPYESFYHVTGAMMYDDEYLYIGAKVGDPFPMRSTVSPHVERRLYGNGGCLALRISTDRTMGWPVRGKGRATRGHRELVAEDYNDKLAFVVLWYYEPGQTASLHLSYGMDQHGSLVNPPGYRGAYQRHADGWGYTVEYAIPWSLLHAGDDPPRAGDVLGCTWLVHWAGPYGKQWKGQLVDVVNPDETGWNFQNAATWGRAIYEPANDKTSSTAN